MIEGNQRSAARPPDERLAIAQELAQIVGHEAVFIDDYDLRVYEYDASIDKARPEFVVLPQSAEQVARIVALATRYNLPITPRGGGTGLSGGSIPLGGGIVVSFAKLAKLRETQPDNLRAIVEPGLVNLHLSQKVAHLGLSFVPDPSSQKACTIGGNVAENSGGPHTLAYGVTTNHVHGLEVVLDDGQLIHTGGSALDNPGYDLTGLIVGSEGTLGIVTEATVRLCPLVESVRTMLAVFASVDDASEACSGIIAAGIVPAAMEMMDNLAIRAVEASVHAGYPTNAAAVLLIEVEGLEEAMADLVKAIRAVCEFHGATEVRLAGSAKERALLWAGRKGAFSAMGRISPDFYVMDGVVPRDTLPGVLRRIGDISRESRLKIANVFHAGDGNLHPLVLFDSEISGQEELVRAVGAEILGVCAEVGGSLSGEHGIGFEKRDLMGLIFTDDDLAAMAAVKRAFDPANRFNPDKILPAPGRCFRPTFHKHYGAVGW